jgi:hypothetical protein
VVEVALDAPQQPAGLKPRRFQKSVEGGHPLNESGAPLAGDSLDVIQRLAQSDAPLKVLVETTTLDINAGQPAIDYVRAALQHCHAVTANGGQPSPSRS